MSDKLFEQIDLLRRLKVLNTMDAEQVRKKCQHLTISGHRSANVAAAAAVEKAAMTCSPELRRLVGGAFLRRVKELHDDGVRVRAA